MEKHVDANIQRACGANSDRSNSNTDESNCVEEDNYGRLYKRSRKSLKYQTASKRLSRRKGAIVRRRQQLLKQVQVDNISFENSEEHNNVELLNKNEEVRKGNDNMHMTNYEQPIQDLLIENVLSEMGLRTKEQVPEETETMRSTELMEVLQEIEIENDTLITDTNLDSYRTKAATTTGNCIMNFSYVFEQLHEKFDEHCRGIECSFRDLIFLGVRAHGLKNELFFKCRMCNFESAIWSEPPPHERINVNAATVAGAMLTGIGYTQLRQNCAAMNIKFMAPSTYQAVHEIVAEGFQKAAEHSMNAAAAEERSLAIENNEIINGIPYISVIGDGSWMKRSYRTGRYDSLCGVGTICGVRTGKVLHLAIRNKYCAVCVKAEKLEKEAPHHKCYKNWGRNCSSTSMEADAIVEGFKTSVEKRGLIYSTFIADGDSSVYKKIVQANPYPNIFIEKIECKNHLLRNLAGKIKEIAKTKGRFGKLRNVIASRILRIRTAVTKAVQHRNEENAPINEKIFKLKKDLNNVISHVFGEHSDCSNIAYFCDGSLKENEENYVPQLKKCVLYEKLQTAMKQMSWHAKSLLQDKDSNRVETFNSIISKCIGGKRVNYGLRGSYEARCNAAVVAFNTGNPISRLCEYLQTKPGENAVKLEEMKKAEKAKLCENKRTRTYKVRHTTTDKDYGPRAEKPDADPTEIKLRIAQHMNMLYDWQKKKVEIEKETKEQTGSAMWYYYRRKILTASHFGHICKMRASTSCAARVKLIAYPQEIQVEAMQHGIE